MEGARRFLLHLASSQPYKADFSPCTVHRRFGDGNRRRQCIPSTLPLSQHEILRIPQTQPLQSTGPLGAASRRLSNLKSGCLSFEDAYPRVVRTGAKSEKPGLGLSLGRWSHSVRTSRVLSEPSG